MPKKKSINKEAKRKNKMIPRKIVSLPAHSWQVQKIVPHSSPIYKNQHHMKDHIFS
jgi:hypothetical protein